VSIVREPRVVTRRKERFSRRRCNRLKALFSNASAHDVAICLQ
jgi:hypothetical protein